MKQIIISEEEARMIVKILRINWVSLDDQTAVFNLVTRIERELEG